MNVALTREAERDLFDLVATQPERAMRAAWMVAALRRAHGALPQASFAIGGDGSRATIQPPDGSAGWHLALVTTPEAAGVTLVLDADSPSTARVWAVTGRRRERELAIAVGQQRARGLRRPPAPRIAPAGPELLPYAQLLAHSALATLQNGARRVAVHDVPSPGEESPGQYRIVTVTVADTLVVIGGRHRDETGSDGGRAAAQQRWQPLIDALVALEPLRS